MGGFITYLVPDSPSVLPKSNPINRCTHDVLRTYVVRADWPSMLRIIISAAYVCQLQQLLFIIASRRTMQSVPGRGRLLWRLTRVE